MALCEVEEQAVVAAQQAADLAQITLQLAQQVLMLCRSQGGGLRTIKPNNKRKMLLNAMTQTCELLEVDAKELSAAVAALAKQQ